MPPMFLHIFAVTLESMVRISNERNLQDLLEAPDLDGYYYELIDKQDGFKIIKHSQQEPYQHLENAHYSGPISPQGFLDICSRGEPFFIGTCTSEPIEVVVKEPSKEMLDKARAIHDAVDVPSAVKNQLLH